MTGKSLDCAGFRGLLDRLPDDDLSGAERRRLEEHLSDCAACREEAELQRRLAERVAALPRRIEPPRDLWPGIGRRLAPRRRPRLRVLPPAAARRGGPALAALAALLALAVGLWLWPTPPEAVRVPSPEAPPLAARAEVARSEDGMLRAHRDLLESLERQRQRLAPETVAAIEADMRLLDEAIGQIRSALDEDPHNRRLSVMLAAKYQHEVDLLKRVSGV